MRHSPWTYWNLFLVLFFACTQPDSGGREESGEPESRTLGVRQQALTGDADGDGVTDAADNCPQLANADQANTNGVGPGDACELSLVLSPGLLNQYARFQSHKELMVSLSPLTLSLGPDLLRTEPAAPSLSLINVSLLTLKLGVQSPGELLPSSTESIDGNEVLRIRLGGSSVLGGAKASEVYLRLDGTATVSVAFFEGSTARGSQSLSTSGTSLKRFAPSAGTRFDRIELRATSGRVSLRGPNEAVIFTLGQAQLACASGYERVGDACVDIDECAGLSHACDALTTCTNTQGSYSCGPCPAGYRGTGSTSCLDIDECAEQSDGCDALVTCSNTAGGYQCGACPPGYRGDGRSCADIDECAEQLDSCDPLVTCSNRLGGYDCGACPPGYAGGGSTGCSDVDECTGPDHVCDSLVSCTNNPGGYSCGDCPGGYRGNGHSCTDIDECLEGSAQCSPLVPCGNTAGSYQCGACPTGFVGDGHSCTDIDECANGTAQCAQGVSCTNNVGGYTCGACPSGYSGDGHLCTDINECESDPCDARVACTNSPGSYTCAACPAGFRGDGYSGCVDVDECAEDLDTCSPLVTCGNTLGSYACSECPAGYQGDGHTCTDVDECAAQTDQCDALVTCTNTVGSYSCGPCPNGYRSEAGACIDLDECQDDPCAALTTCTNTPGSYTCSACPAGYQGDGYAGCLDIDECAVQNGSCPQSERCVNTPGSHRCESCTAGSVGVPTQCGVGACASTGVTSCVQGEVRNSCVPGPAAATDATCNALDDDCDGAIDEDFTGSNSACGVGVCAAAGLIRCVSGQVVNTCTPGAPRGPDVSCDATDDDCDGSVDEEFTAQVDACGVGACRRTVSRDCVNGSLSGDACVPGIPATVDLTCNGVDEDCDGSADEEYPVQSSVCGVGACLAGGVVSCVNGSVVNSCMPGLGASTDVTCDGIDDDCDGAVDEDFVQSSTSCGAGACAGSGTLRCVNGSVQNSCAVPVGASCDDGDQCNGGDRCDASGACAPAAPSSVCCAGATVTDPLTHTTLDPHVTTGFAATVAPLYTGGLASQWPVTAGAIDGAKVAVIRGQVLDAQGNPMSCVNVSVVNAPQYGATRSRADGSYALAVQGGAQLNLRFEAPGFITSYRTLAPEVHRFEHAPDVRLLAHAPAQPVSASAATITVVAGELETDEDGSRRATLLFPPGTLATVAGESSPRTQFGVRVKEMTNRSVSGRDGMPATLPVQSAFTYAFSMSLEGAESAQVTFNQPIPIYVENFLGFPVGETVPVGSYNEAISQWVAEETGRIIGIVGVDAQGRALVNIDKTAGADDPTSLGMSDAERVQLATRYAVGQSLWRFRAQHFSAWDANWGWGPPEDAEAPSQPPPVAEQLLKGITPSCANGSIIECENQVLREEVDVAGTPFQLVYSSARQLGSPSQRLRIPMTGPTVPPKMGLVDLWVEVAGKLYRRGFSAGPNQSHTFVWDRLDGSGRFVPGPQVARVKLGYVYGAMYQQTARFGYSGNGVAITGDAARMRLTLWQVTDVTLGGVDARYAELGGWTLGAHHFLDKIDDRVFLGDGSDQSRLEGATAVQVVANASMPVVSPRGRVLEGPDGSFYMVTDQRVRRVAPDGTVSVLAGGGGNQDPYANDVLANTLSFRSLGHSPAWGPDGTLYLVHDNAVSKVDVSSGKIYHVVTLDLATAQQSGPLAVAADGTVYAGQAGKVLRARDGQVTAWGAGFSSVSALATDADGNVLVGDATQYGIYRISIDGQTELLVGGGTQRFYEGIPATSINLFADILPSGIVVDAKRTVYFVGYNNVGVYRLNADGTLSRIVGTGGRGRSPAGTLASRMLMETPQQLSIARNGDLLILDAGNQRLLRLALPKDGDGTRVFPDQNGRELYYFDQHGYHTRTVDRSSGATLFEFGYDAKGRLARVTDDAGGVTQIERDEDGQATAIVAPHGQRTELVMDDDARLERVERPDGSVYSFGYGADGLLSSMRDPKSHEEGTQPYHFHYTDGFLDRDTDPTGAAQTLARSTVPNGWKVSRTTQLQRTTTHQTTNVNQLVSRSTVAPDGSTSSSDLRLNMSATITGPGGKLYDEKQTAADGTATYVLHSQHSAYGTDKAVPVETATVLPSGLTRVDTQSESTNVDVFTSVVLSSTHSARVNGRTSATTVTYNGSTRTFELTSPLQRKVKRILDAKGRTVRIEGAGALPVDLTYDSEGRLERTVQGTRETVYGYAAEGPGKGYLESVRDALSHETRFTRDALGRPREQWLPDNQVIGFDWDGLGNLIAVAPPERPYHTQAFSPVGLQTSYTAPLAPELPSRTTTYVPDADRNLKSITWPDGRKLSVTYTSGGKPDLVTAAEGAYDHDYYGAGSCAGCAPGVAAPVG